MTCDLSWLRTLPGKPTIVAEVKLRSPYGWVNPLGLWDALDVCEAIGDVISVHTNPLWGGSFEQLALVRSQTKKPILAKDFHPTVKHVEMAFDAGADYVLTVGWWPGDERCWHEAERPYDLDQRDAAPRMVWNARNPRTDEARTVSAASARTLRQGWLCQASHIRGPEDVVPGMDAILIGERLYTP